MANYGIESRRSVMGKKLLEEMSVEAFERAVHDFIASEQTEVPTSVFFQALALIDQEKKNMGQVVRLQTRVVGDKLVFVPTEPESRVTVENNEILLEDGRRIVLELVSDAERTESLSGQANIAEEDDWIQWEATTDMLEVDDKSRPR
jgi:hypothetical protein